MSTTPLIDTAPLAAVLVVAARSCALAVAITLEWETHFLPLR